MPAAGIHLCIAKKLLNDNLDKERFYVGNIAPDSWRNSNSNKHEVGLYSLIVPVPFFNSYIITSFSLKPCPFHFLFKKKISYKFYFIIYIGYSFFLKPYKYSP